MSERKEGGKMMGVFIEGMEMPKTNVMLLIEPDGKVWEMGDLLGDDKLLDGVKAIPAADVREVKLGKWISDHPGKNFGKEVRLDKDGCPVATCHCSECGEWLTASDEYPVKGRFCPNCGARMEES